MTKAVSQSHPSRVKESISWAGRRIWDLIPKSYPQSTKSLITFLQSHWRFNLLNDSLIASELQQTLQLESEMENCSFLLIEYSANHRQSERWRVVILGEPLTRQIVITNKQTYSNTQICLHWFINSDSGRSKEILIGNKKNYYYDMLLKIIDNQKGEG